MAYSIAQVGSSVTMTVTFRSWSEGTQTSQLDDPDSVIVQITNDAASPTLVLEDAPTSESLATYSYTWTPTEEGTFEMSFIGTFSDLTTDVISQTFVVGPSTVSGLKMSSDYEYVIAGVITPLFIDPSELSIVFEDATNIEIAEAIYNASVDIAYLLKLEAGEIPDHPLALEYVKAAAACALSKVHGSALMDADSDAVRMRLGDLEVQKGNGSMYAAKSKVTLENASTWCEYALVLRKELMMRGAKIKSVVKGANYINPIPRRHFRPDPGNWPARRHQGDLDDEPTGRIR